MMKPVLHILGLGKGGLEDLTLRSYRLLLKADKVLVISLEDQVVREMLTEGIPCQSVISDRNSFKLPQDLNDFISALKDKKNLLKGDTVLALPGTPLPEGKIITALRENLNDYKLDISPLRQECSIERLETIMAELRSEGGCPWDREQDHFTLKKYLIEEAYEVIDAIDAKNMNNFCEELGDLLLQVVFHARIAEESGDFGLTDIIRGISDKLIRRHPHVFGSVVADSSEEVIFNWDIIKMEEKGNILKEQNFFNFPKGLPALLYAYKTQKQAAKVGFDWGNYEGPLAKIYEEMDELTIEIEKGGRIKEEIGDILFSLVNLSRFLDIDPEDALRQGTIKFQKRFNEMRSNIAAEGKNLEEMSLKEMDNYWNIIKNKKNMVL